MKIQWDFNLKENNTFKIKALAKRFIEFDSDSDFVEFLKMEKNFTAENILIIGEGSNLLFRNDFNGTVIHPVTKNLQVSKTDDEHLFVEASAGVIWDSLVEWTLENEAYGLENLSLIPGTVGASAVQNIGAYGAEAGDYINSVKCVNLETAEIFNLTASECEFAYRDSVFKTERMRNCLILSVTFKLNRKPILKINYADILNFFGDKVDISPIEIREAVISIRTSKLPDPEITGNAGSFFKNPVVDEQKFMQLLSIFPDLKYYNNGNGNYKLAAGWLIDKAGLKGYKMKAAGVHENQALVLINLKGEATGNDILELSDYVKSKVFEMFGVLLEPEVIFV